MNRLNNLNDLLFEKTLELHDCEKQLIQELPVLIERATDSELKSILRRHYHATDSQLKRVERAFGYFEKKNFTQNDISRNHLKTLYRYIGKSTNSEVKDAAILTTMKEISGYKIAAYEVACTLADSLNHPALKDYLCECLKEEQQMVKRLHLTQKEVLELDK